MEAGDRRVVVGRVVGLFGIRGWVKVYSYTRPTAAILDYDPWLVKVAEDWRPFSVATGHPQGRGLVAQLVGIADRDAAEPLVGAEIAVRRTQLAALSDNEYYWAELEGLRVVTVAGRELGHVDHLLATGANDVLVVRGERERLIPFTRQAIAAVDLDTGLIRVDWDPED